VRFVSRGFFQREGVDYKDTFAPIVRYTSIREIMSLVLFMGWMMHRMDVKTTFLNVIVDPSLLGVTRGDFFYLIHIFDISFDYDILDSPQTVANRCLPLHAQLTHIR
jgi:hypothetical protein